MARYRRVITEIEAYQIPTSDEWPDRPDWISDAIQAGDIRPTINDFRIVTSEGPVLASCGDYIARDVEGGIYPIRASVFHKTYEEIR